MVTFRLVPLPLTVADFQVFPSSVEYLTVTVLTVKAVAPCCVSIERSSGNPVLAGARSRSSKAPVARTVSRGGNVVVVPTKAELNVHDTSIRVASVDQCGARV